MKRVSHATSAASCGERGRRGRVAVDRDQRAGRPEPLGDQPRVAGAAERAVDGDLARSRVQRLDQLAGENRDVRLGHVKKDGQGTR